MKRFALLINKIPSWLSSAIVLSLTIYASLNDDPLRGHDFMLFKGADKCIQFLMYFAFTSALMFDYTKSKLPHHTKLNIELVLTFTSIVIGVVLEVLQSLLTDTRAFDAFDMIANSLGSICAFFAMRFWFCKKFRRAVLSRYTKRSRRHSKRRSRRR